MSTFPPALDLSGDRAGAVGGAVASLRKGITTVLLGPPGCGRTAVASAIAQRCEQEGMTILWARPDVEPLAAAVARWCKILDVDAPLSWLGPRPLWRWAQLHLRDRLCLLVFDSVPESARGAVGGMIAPAPAALVVSEGGGWFEGDEITLAAMGEAEAWRPALSGALLKGEGAQWLAAAPAAGIDEASAALMPTDERRRWAASGLFRPTGDGRLALPPSLWRALREDGGDDARGMKQAWVKHIHERLLGGPELTKPMPAARANLAPSLGFRSVARPHRRCTTPSAALGRESPDLTPSCPARDGLALVSSGGDDIPLESVIEAAKGGWAVGAAGPAAALSAAALTRMMAWGMAVEALGLLRRWRHWADEAGDERQGAVVCLEEGKAFETLGSLPRAVEAFASAHEKARESGARGLCAVALAAQGRVAAKRGAHGAAIGHYRDAQQIFGDVGDERGRAAALAGEALSLAASGQVEEAIAAFEAHLPIAIALGDLPAATADHRHLGLAWLKLGEHARAIPPLKEARAGSERLGDGRGQGIALRALATCYTAVGELSLAREAWLGLIPLARSLDDLPGEVLCHKGLAELSLKGGDCPAAVEHLNDALVAIRQRPHAHLEGPILRALRALQA